MRPGSGGAGKWRGGLGQSIEVTSANDAPFLVFLSVERISFPAEGRAGGMAGAPGRMRLDNKPDLPSKCELRIEPGETLYFDTPGGGGYGDPEQRERDLVAKDLEEGLITVETARDIYGLKEE